MGSTKVEIPMRAGRCSSVKLGTILRSSEAGESSGRPTESLGVAKPLPYFWQENRCGVGTARCFRQPFPSPCPVLHHIQSQLVSCCYTQVQTSTPWSCSEELLSQVQCQQDESAGMAIRSFQDSEPLSRRGPSGF